MNTNVKTTGAGRAHAEILQSLHEARMDAFDSSSLAMENLAHLRGLFKVIGSLAKAGDLESIAIIAVDGEYHADDWHNLHDCQRESSKHQLDAMKGV